MVDPLNEDSELGGWTVKELTETALAFPPGVGADEEVTPPRRFLRGVYRIVRRRRTESSSTPDPARPAVFLLYRQSDQIAGGKFVPMLDNGLTQLTERMWFLPPAPRTGRYVSIAGLDDAQIFEMVTETLSLGTVPAAIFDPRPKTAVIRFYPSGLKMPDNVEEFAADPGTITLGDLLATVDDIYVKQLVVPRLPEPALRPWHNASQCRPSIQAEKILQASLRCGLQTKFPSCDVLSEETKATGRLDLKIEERSSNQPGKIICHAVLELKVLRSYTVTGEVVPELQNLKAIEDGLDQASSYRDEWNAASAALCCFDMRKEPSGTQCFAHVQSVAEERKVALRLWFLWSSSKAYRRHLAAPKKKAPAKHRPKASGRGTD